MSSALIAPSQYDPTELLAYGASPYPRGLALPKNLAPAIRDAAQAALDPRATVGRQETDLLQVSLIGWLSGALFNLNHANSYADRQGDEPGTQIELLAGQVAKMVQRRFPSFRPAEVQEAITRGSAGDWYNPAQGYLVLSVPTVQGWLSAYQQEARRPALDVLEKVANDLGDGPRQENLPDWHPVAFGLTSAVLCGLVGRVQAGAVLDDFDFDVLAYDWLDRLGILARFRTHAERQAMLDAEIAKLGDPLTPYLTDASKGRSGELKSFRQALARVAQPAQHPVMSEAKGNARRALFRAWLQSWDSPRACYVALLDCWASFYFTHFQALNDVNN
jgi:hypothetical protein